MQARALLFVTTYVWSEFCGLSLIFWISFRASLCIVSSLQKGHLFLTSNRFSDIVTSIYKKGKINNENRGGAKFLIDHFGISKICRVVRARKSRFLTIFVVPVKTSCAKISINEKASELKSYTFDLLSIIFSSLLNLGSFHFFFSLLSFSVNH